MGVNNLTEDQHADADLDPVVELTFEGNRRGCDARWVDDSILRRVTGGCSQPVCPWVWTR